MTRNRHIGCTYYSESKTYISLTSYSYIAGNPNLQPRYSCPPSTRTRIAAVAAVALMNVLTVTTGRSLEPKIWEHDYSHGSIYSLFTDFYPGGAIDFLNRSESILEEGRTNPRILVNSMFLRIIRF